MPTPTRPTTATRKLSTNNSVPQYPGLTYMDTDAPQSRGPAVMR